MDRDFERISAWETGLTRNAPENIHHRSSMIEAILAIEGIEAIATAGAGLLASELIGLSKSRHNSLASITGAILIRIGKALQGDPEGPTGREPKGRNFS